jgi:hypothetical protein
LIVFSVQLQVCQSYVPDAAYAVDIELLGVVDNIKLRHQQSAKLQNFIVDLLILLSADGNIANNPQK